MTKTTVLAVPISVFVLTLALAPRAAEAELYKCTDAAGR